MIPLILKTDYSLCKSLITIRKLIDYLSSNSISSCAITDNNLYGSIEFYNACIESGIKPIIGFEITINTKNIYLYAEDYTGYQNLLKVNTIIQDREITIADLNVYNGKIACIIPFMNSELWNELSTIFEHTFIAFTSSYEKNNALVITKNVVFANLILSFTKEDTDYLKYLDMIEKGTTVSNSEPINYEKNYFLENIDTEDEQSTINFAKLCNLEIPKNNKYIPSYDANIKDSYEYMVALAMKGIKKRLGGTIPPKYIERLKLELDMINKMGYVDYFLIVYDYVKFAKKNNIMVGPGRGSAAGSLVSYCLGITNVDPLEYDLLFERFLNPERITMPDIDIDFEYTKRDQVINHIRSRYGKECVAPIMTFGTLKSKQVIRDVARVCELNPVLLDKFSSLVDTRISLEKNIKTNKALVDFINNNSDAKKIYKIALKLENLKRHVSTHAAGVVISSSPLDTIIPICKSGDITITGVTMEYLEDFGLLKMDLLALRNLTIIANVLELIQKGKEDVIDINKIPLDDEDALKLFNTANTIGIFQFESAGMINFLRKLKPTTFSDLVAAVALFRPGPMANIDTFIKRKEGKIPVNYLHEDLKSILSDTYGIIIYQEQVMQILVKMAGYSFSEADNIRRAMSKKNEELMRLEEKKFIEKSMKRGYSKEIAQEVYDLILKFANYGFVKAHSVAYALIGYQMAYLKSKYPSYFLANLLNMSIGSEIKTKEYIIEAQKEGIKILKPDINSSVEEYKIIDNSLQLPLSAIKSTGVSACTLILEERQKGEYKDYFDFVSRTYGKSVTTKTIESLIDAGALETFGVNHQMLTKNIAGAITYAELTDGLNEMFVMKPEMDKYPEYSESELMRKEQNVLGFFITNHPSSKYNDLTIMKLNTISNNFDKNVKCVVIVNDIKVIKTKKNEDMAFISATDETGEGEFIVFPKKNNLINIIKKDDLITVYGTVGKRLDKYQIIVNNMEKI